MNIIEIISRKRDGAKLGRDEINYFVDEYTGGGIADYQASAFLMAALLQGLDDEETYILTRAMLESGRSIKFPKSADTVYDKHSTGGVGDKISLTLSPLIASMGINIAMLSGRGLGHTGGTLDKLESIKGLNPFWTEKQIRSRLKKCGIAISGQTKDIAPADKKLYALRDATATVESIPLITASILSKKLALGTDGIVFDIKVGSGAFMKTRREASKLARSLLNVCRSFKRPAACLMTDMSEPLGYNVGNFLEVMEALEFLKTGRPEDIGQVTYNLGYEIIRLSDRRVTKKTVFAKFDELIANGDALKKFREYALLSGADKKVLDDPDKYFRPKSRGYIRASKSGYLHEFDCELIGRACQVLGAGRYRIEDKIDPFAGAVLTKKIGDYVRKNEVVLQLFSADKKKINSARKMFAGAFKIGKEKIASKRKIITLIKQ